MPLVTAAQAAEILDVDAQQVYNLASRGALTRHARTHVRMAYDLGEIGWVLITTSASSENGGS